MVYGALFLWLLAFIFPVGLYPFQDFLRDYLTIFGAILLFAIVFWNRKSEISYSSLLIFFPVGFLGLLASYMATAPSVSISYNLYLITLLTCACISLSVNGLQSTIGRNFVIKRLACFLLLAAVLSGVIGLLRYYGVLRHLLPVITSDGDRFLGPLGQPNLTAILMAISLNALIFLRFQRYISRNSVFYSLLTFLIYCGTLTASRSWYISVFLVLLLWWLFSLRVRANKKPVDGSFGKSLLIAIALFLIAIWVVPAADEIISKPMIDSGYVNRISAETLYQNRPGLSSSGRIAEWRKILNVNYQSQEFWFGYGAGRYGAFSNHISLKQGLQGNGQIWNNAHNIFIEFFIEFGVLGLMFILALFLYISIAALRIGKSGANLFLLSVVSVLIFHSLVEFSLWSLPFLAIFVAVVSLLGKSRSFTFSGVGVKRSFVAFLMIVFIPFGLYVGQDALTVVGVMYNKSPGLNDRFALQDAGRSSILGDKAISVMVLKFLPPLTGIRSELAQVSMLADWRQEPLFMLRKSSLLAAAGEREKACVSIEHTIKLYPDTVVPIQNELNYLRDDIGEDFQTYYQCIFNGVDSWVKPNSGS